MRKLPAPSAADTLRVHAVARLMLDNIPHVKAFWIATGVDVAQASLWFGVDDLDGTVQEERIYHMAGATSPEAHDAPAAPDADPPGGPRAGGARHALQRRPGAGSEAARSCRSPRHRLPTAPAALRPESGFADSAAASRQRPPAQFVRGLQPDASRRRRSVVAGPAGPTRYRSPSLLYSLCQVSAAIAASGPGFFVCSRLRNFSQA